MQFEPESLSSMQQRYKAALEKLWKQHELVVQRFAQVSGGPDYARPGNTRANVFDHDDGWRLIISRELTEQGETVLHVSGSVEVRSPAADMIERISNISKLRSDHAIQVFVRSRFQEISGDDVLSSKLTLVMMSPMGVVHYKADLVDGSEKDWNPDTEPVRES